MYAYAHVSADDPRSYYQVAKDCTKRLAITFINQYFNDLNIEAHYQTTGGIWEQTSGQITSGSSGTGGTISNC